ncbi:MAG: hypothetical protein ACLFQK_08605 [Fibrobacterota bacterium]
MSSEKSCADCKFRKKYDEKPRSLLGRLWRWHANWCPGWNGYMKELPAEERKALAERYGQKKYM